MKYLKILLAGASILPFLANATSAPDTNDGPIKTLAEDTWAGYPIREDGWVDTTTDNWIGWLSVTQRPWIYSTTLSTWLWAQDPGAGASGLWTYIKNKPAPSSSPQTWQEAWDTSDQEVIDAWYEANTGPSAINVTMDDMWQPGRVAITQSWLTTNQGDHVFQEGNRWVVYAVNTPSFNIGVDNVTIRGCFLTLTGTVFGFSGSGKNAVIEYCEVTSDGTSPQSMKGMSDITDITVRYNKTYGLPHTMWRINHNSLAEYNYVHSGVLGIKHVAIAIRGNNSHTRRNNLQTSSGSQTLGIYSHDVLAPPTGLTNVLVEENLINSKESYFGIMAGGNWNTQTQQATNVVVVNNRFGVKWNPCCGWAGSNYLWLGRAAPGEIEDSRGNVWSGNRWLTTINYAQPITGQGDSCPDDVYDDPGVEADGYSHTTAAERLQGMFLSYQAR